MPGRLLLIVTLALSIEVVLGPQRVFAQIACDDAYLQAEDEYREGAFRNAITLLAPCVDTFESGTDRDREAHRLLALAYLRSDELDEARLVIVEMFARNPRYEADPIADPPAFVSLVNLVREEVGVQSRADDRPGGGSERPVWYRSPRTWLYAAGGIVVGTAAIIAIGGGGGGNGNAPSLPVPPAFP